MQNLLPTPARAASNRHQRVVAVVYVAAMFMALMDTTVVNVALPALGRDLHVGADAVGRVSVVYLVSLAVFLPVSSWWEDRIGGRRALLGAIAVFTLASALCGLSTGFGELVVFRVLQGAGAAVMTPVGLSMLFRVYRPDERLRISGVLAVFTALAPALGPVLGGVFTTFLSWRLVFFVNVPLGVAVLAYGGLRLVDHARHVAGPLDLPGLLLSASGLGCTLYGVSLAPVRGWTAGSVIAPLAAGIALLVALVAVEWRAVNPLIDLRLFRNHLFRTSSSLYALGSVAYLGALFMAALFFQDGLDLSAVQAGLMTAPSAMGTMCGGQLVTRALYWRFGPRRVIATGLPVMAATMAAMSRVTSGTPLWIVGLIMWGLGFGVSFVFVPAQTASMATIGSALTAKASSLYNTAKQLGSALGVALLGTVFAATNPSSRNIGRHTTALTAFHAGFLTAACTAVAAIAVALTLKDAEATATMVPPRRRRIARSRPEPAPSRR